jgi:hypothetical protein
MMLGSSKTEKAAEMLLSKRGVRVGGLFPWYPMEIKRQLAELFDTVIETLPQEKIYSIVMLGSTPRGELSYRQQGDSIDIFSDYEFVIVYRQPFLKRELDLLDKQLSDLTEKWGIRSPLFHIDYGVASKAKFAVTPPTFWAFEAKNCGINVFGHDATELLPDVTTKNLDYGVLNELVLVRLWNMLLALNEGFVRDGGSEYERFTVSLSYARNALDILSILLPAEGTLLAGYESRTKCFINDKHADGWEQYKELFAAVTRFKLNKFEEGIDLLDTQSLFLDGFTKLLLVLSGERADAVHVNPFAVDRIDFRRIFREKKVRQLRRKYMDFRLYTTYYQWKPGKISTLWSDKLRQHLVASLLFMHFSLDGRLDPGWQLGYLKTAFDRFRLVANDDSICWISNDSFSENWLRLRRTILELMIVWFYGRSRESVSRLNNLMEWRDK